MHAPVRTVLIGELENRFKPFTDTLIKELRRWQFPFAEEKSLHLLHLNQALIVRHSLPYCLSEEAYFSLEDHDVKFFASVVLLHSLALTRIDDYYDGGHRTKGGMLTVDGIAYSLSATHQATITLLRQAPSAPELAKMLKLTAFIHARMYKDHTERYKLDFLQYPERRLHHYLHSPKSRLLGSGYWEVMARAAFAQRGRPFPAYLHSIDLRLRKLRQMVDELADIEEDLRGGLITLPVLYALQQRPSAVGKSIAKYWQSGATNDTELAGILNLVEETRAKQWLHRQAMTQYQEGTQKLSACLGKRGEGYQRLFEYKRAKLELLIKS